SDGEILTVNEAWLDKLGYDREVVERRWFGEFLAKDSVAKFESRFSEFKSTGGISNVEYEMQCADGESIIVSFDGTIEYDEDGAFVRTHCQFAEITERKELERINTVIRNLNQELVQAASTAEIDQNVCEVLGNSEPYVFAWIGEHDQQSATVEPRSAAGISKEYLEKVEITTDEAATGQGPTGTAVRSGEVSVMQNIPDDPRYEPWREYALEYGYKSSAAIPLQFDDTLYGVLNVYADRTYAFGERERQVLSELGEIIAQSYHRVELQRKYAEQYRTLFEEAPVMVVQTRSEDGEPIIEDCNRTFADRLGYPVDELRGKPLADYYTETSSQKLLDEDGYQRALEGDFIREQRRLVTREGDEILTVLRASPRRNRDGDVIGTHAMYLDITEEEQIQELKRQNERLDEFASIVSHDLRNPLNVAKGRIALAQEEYDSDDLDTAARSIERSLDLIEDMLTLARKGKQVSDTQPVEVASLVETCWDNVETANATLAADLDSTIQADRSRLQQLLENLIRNAVEHGGEDVTVRVGALADGFFVADDGPGIPEDERDSVFEPGYSTDPDGTGFGLPIVKRIAEAHNWEVKVTEGTDGGARFEFTDIEGIAE
ncbi:MAG: PAS domain S-box protein, partial [Halobacteriaceae archaeon]